MSLAPPPELVEDALMEILLRVPPDDPAQILRASLVSKRWSRILSSPGFRRRLHELHGTPPLLGFFHKMNSEPYAVFVPTTSSAFSLPVPSPINGGWALDYRHGRALFLPKRSHQSLLVWDPITGDQRRVPWPAKFRGGHDGFSASVLCAAQDRCDHRACHGGSFLVVVVFNRNAPKPVTSACVYSSETGLWSELTSVDQCAITCNNVLVGKSLLYFQCLRGRILEYDLARRGLAVVMGTPDDRCEESETAVMQAEDGGLGVAVIQGSCLQLWSRDGDGGWVQSRVIDLTNMLPDAVFEASQPNRVIAFAAEVNAVFLGTVCGVFMIELQSTRVRKVSNDRSFYKAIPVISFYTPGKGANRMVCGPDKSSPAKPKPKRTKNASLRVSSTSAEVPQEQLVTTPMTRVVTASQVENNNKPLTRSRKKQLELAGTDATSPSTSNAVKNAHGVQQVAKRSKVTRAKKK